MVLSIAQMVAQSEEDDRPVKIQDEDNRWLLPRAQIDPLQNKTSFTSEELSYPKIFSEGNISITFPQNETPGIGLAISNFDSAGEIVFYSDSGVELHRMRWDSPSPNMLGESILGKVLRFNGGELWMNTSGSGIFVFHNRSLRDNYLITGNDMEWTSAHSVDTFCLPLIDSDELPLNRRLTTSIRASSGRFSALIYDDNFHLLAEVNDEQSATRQIALGESTTAFFVITSDVGETLEVELYYSPVDSRNSYSFLFLVIETILLMILVARYLMIYHLKTRGKPKYKNSKTKNR
jgi:hypothetical protein